MPSARHLSGVLILVLLASTHVQASSTTRRQCCEAPSGTTLTAAEVAQFEQCVCLHDNVELSDQTLSAGQFGYFHWRVSDFSLIDHDDDNRPEVCEHIYFLSHEYVDLYICKTHLNIHWIEVCTCDIYV
jgi:hypothetical protein